MRGFLILLGGVALGHAIGCSVINKPDEPVDPDGVGAGSCEPPFTTLDHCGACGTPCAPENVQTASCGDGSCAYDSCSVGFGDCDSDQANGCETDTLADASHCGSCSESCDATGLLNVQGAACVNGSCTYSSCSPGWDDCDGTAGNGCEHAVDTLMECGACNTPCAPTNVNMPACLMGQCGYDMCAAGWDDCDTDTSNGCETDTSASLTDCGMCGMACAVGEICDMGACRGPASCLEIKNGDPNAADGMHVIDPDGAGGAAPISVFCNMTVDGGGWTECLSFVNTAQEDLSCTLPAEQNYFHRCVDWTMASWSGNEVLVALYTNQNTQVYAGFGTRPTPWSYANLTSPNAAGGQYDRSSQHANLVPLQNGHRLTVSGFNGDVSGWGGSWGNGYVIVVDTAPCYACNVVLSAMSYTQPVGGCAVRSFLGMTPGHELMFNLGGGITTNGNIALTAAQAFTGQLKFFVR